MDVLVRLEDTDFIIRELDAAGMSAPPALDVWKHAIRETFDQSELVLDVASIRLGLLFRLVQFVCGGVLLQCDLGIVRTVLSKRRGSTLYVVERHAGSASSGE